MNIFIRTGNNFAIIDIQTQNINVFLVKKIEKEIFKLINIENKNIYLNLSHVETITNEFLDFLFKLQNICELKSINLGIFGLHPDVLTIFFVTALDSHINIFDSEYNAINNKDKLVKRRLKLVKK